VVLAEALRERHPDLVDASAALAAGRVLVDGRPVLNPAARVLADATISVMPDQMLRGSTKLATALDGFGVEVDGRVALDVGAAAGGFTAVLLERGVERVYAIDAGHGQLRGSLRQDPRVVSRERTNLGDLDDRIVPEPVGVVSVDLSYLSLATAVPQLERVRFATDADLVALVKPMFELGLPAPPTDAARVGDALARAGTAIGAGAWTVVGSMPSPVPGARGAAEAFLHARRRAVH
jgi:23S rRNA (cytidine1920-2'-O)/16S rRNA (cytidine1409-2'-O)-methyltransferase